MKICCLLFIFAFASGLGFCQSAKTEKREDEIIVIAEKENRKYNLTATFYGIRFRPDENREEEYKIITYVVFRDNKSGAEVIYKPMGIDNSKATGVGSVITSDFYFTEVWSPDGEHIVLPLGKFEGFVIFEAKNALENIKFDKHFDALKVKSETSGFFYHNFEKWEDDSTFSFRAGLHGDMFAFRYEVRKKQLYCYRENCEASDIGMNTKGTIKAIKKGDIKPTKIH
jgi:hypothetical protein